MSEASPAIPRARLGRRRMGAIERRNLRWGLLFISPWLFGFLVLGVFPILYTFYLSLTRYSGLRDPIFIGVANYQRMAADPLFWKATYNTLYYTLLAVPIGVVGGHGPGARHEPEAQRGRGLSGDLLPPLDPAGLRDLVHLRRVPQPRVRAVEPRAHQHRAAVPNWLGDPAYTKLALVMIAQLGAGQFALIFLAGLKGIPVELYESASIDGAGPFRKFFSITLPLMTPVILYDLIIGLSLGLQVFTPAFILTGGGERAAGPDNSLLTFVFFIYRQAFQFGQMGYAAAVSVVLFITSLILAIVVFRWARSWVYYEAVR